jgi:two-component sensor histidine kinase
MEGRDHPDWRDDSWMTLVGAIEKLSAAHQFDEIVLVVRSFARRLSGADGVCIVLRDGDLCHYIDEDAIGPLWKGKRFPLSACISGWCMLNRKTAIIADVYRDERIPADAYRPTFVRSLVMVPVRLEDPLAAIGAYWAAARTPDAVTVTILEILAQATATALAGANHFQSLTQRMAELAELYKFTDRLHRAKSLADVYESALDAILGALSCSRASILLFDHASVLRFAAWRGLSDKYRIAVEGHSPWTTDVSDPGPICVNDIDAVDIAEPLKSTVRSEGVRALAFFPLLVEGNLIGEFATYYEGPHVFTDAEVDLALTIARQLVFSIERLRTEEARRRAQQANEVLISELQHRTRNLLAVVQSIAHQSICRSATFDEFKVKFDGRLTALSRVQGLLSRSNTKIITCGEVVRDQLSALAAKIDTGRVKIQGPDVRLPKGSVQILALALHELATNALKYGALRTPQGRVTITWRLDGEAGDQHLSLDWLESGVDVRGAQIMSASCGYGRQLIENALPYQLGAKTRLDLSKGGAHCSIEIPVKWAH